MGMSKLSRPSVRSEGQRLDLLSYAFSLLDPGTVDPLTALVVTCGESERTGAVSGVCSRKQKIITKLKP
jgi:hypothetical protein